jgi:TonB family protein
MQPWHLKATYQVFDKKGNSLDQGTLEEFWAGPAKYKRIFASATFSQTEYGTEKSILRSGYREALPTNLALIYRDLIAPFPSEKTLSAQPEVPLEKRDVGNMHLLCLSVPDLSSGDNWMLKANFCVDANLPFVRISQYPVSVAQNSPGTSQFLHSNVARFQGRYIAKDIQAFEPITPDSAPKLTLAIHVESIEKLASIDEAVFTPPADALPAPIVVAVDESVSKTFVLDRYKPVYPPIALAARVSGIVVLKARISSDGKVIKLGILSGPAMLQAASLDAVKRWTFRPYLLNNQSEEVDTTITLIFRLDPPLIYSGGDMRNALR